MGIVSGTKYLNGSVTSNCVIFFRMKREFKSWEECINLREVKVCGVSK